mmetsp:Transcript_17180/g.65576  ORF Transcript_17180/g.65576 Transcript_17180/m.65576 type:complete len:241 (-) Transcript_17180:158-880(-)
MFQATPIVIDARGHLLGRLASIVAKELLCGQKVVLVRCEEICVTGSLLRNKVKWTHYRRKRHLTNPKKGPYHFRSPARMFYRVVRGMLPHKLARGQAALSRLSCFEGIPAPWDKKERVVVPEALRVLRLAPQRKFTVLKTLAHEVGWKHKELIERLENKRKLEAQAFHEKKKAAKAQRRAAVKAVDLSEVNEVLEEAGFGEIEGLSKADAAAAAPAIAAAEEAAPAEGEAGGEAAAGGDY